MEHVENHKEHTKNLPIQTKCRDVVEGEDALKDRDLDVGGTYLRMLNPSDTSDYNTARNRAYIRGARLQNFTASTEQGFLGMAFRLPPTEPELDSAVDYIIDDADGTDSPLEQLARSVVKEVIDVGRNGLLTEMPQREEGTTATKADVANGLRASIKSYNAESILDWAPDKPCKKDPLNYVKLEEKRALFGENGDPNKKGEFIRWIILRLKDNVYTQEIWDEPLDHGDMKQTQEPLVIKQAGDKPFDYIPFDFVGTLDNTPTVDKPLLLDIVNVNLAMYQEDANLRATSFAFSAATAHIADDLYFGDFNTPNADKSKKEVCFGESSVIVTGSSGKVSLIAPPNNPLAMEIKNGDREDLVALGAEVIQAAGGQEVIQAVMSRTGAKSSKLSVAIQNVSTAFNSQLANIGLFMGVSAEIKKGFALNTEFFEHDLSPEELQGLISGWMMGAYPKDILDMKLVKGGVIPQGTDLVVMNSAIETTVDVIP